MGFSPTSAAIALLAAPVVGILGVVAWGLMEYVCRRPAARARIFLPKGMVKRVAVVGAGTSGIACAKEALEAGMEVVVFEMTGEIGGNWVYRDRVRCAARARLRDYWMSRARARALSLVRCRTHER